MLTSPPHPTAHTKLAEFTAALLRPQRSFEQRLLSRLMGARQPLHCLAVHLRYGDSCSPREAYRTARRCGSVEEYVTHAEELQRRHGFRSVVLASDSASASREFVRRWARRTPIVTSGAAAVGDALSSEGSVNWERHLDRLAASTAFDSGASRTRGRDGVVSSASADGISSANGDGARAGAEACGEWRGFVDFLADLYLMGACDGLVAKFTSNLPRLSFALQVARRGRLPPYVSIDNSTWCSNSRTGKGRSRWGPFPC